MCRYTSTNDQREYNLIFTDAQQVRPSDTVSLIQLFLGIYTHTAAHTCKTIMLSMLAAIQPGTIWMPWINHITERKNDYGLMKACLVEHNGTICCASKGFQPTAKEIQVINCIFLEKLNNNIVSDRLSFKERTFMIKSLSSTQIIAFSGSKYIIVSRSKTKHIIALCDSKSKYMAAADWLGKLCQKLIQKGF